VSREPDRPDSAPLLAIETATSETIVAVQVVMGGPVIVDRWPSRQAHGERLLASVEGTLQRASIALDDVAAIAVGTGPGSFTGLRIGLATAKGLAFGLGIPIVGVGTAEALARAWVAAVPPQETSDRSSARDVVVAQPAGLSGRYRTVISRSADGSWRAGASELLTTEPTNGADDATIAVDLLEAGADASEAARVALRGLPRALVDAARERMAAGGSDDLAALVPAYVSPPRGAVATDGSITWSRAHP